MIYEVYLGSKSLPPAAWQAFLMDLARLHPDFQKWRLILRVQNSVLHYYLETSLTLPAALDTPDFYLAPATVALPEPLHTQLPRHLSGSFTSISNYLQIRKYETLHHLEITAFSALDTLHTAVKIHTSKGNYKIPTPPATVLAVDFAVAKHFRPQPLPHFLDAHKILPHLSNDPATALLDIQTFPYNSANHYLSASALDLAKHSLVLGASGSGKSKFLGLLISQIAHDPQLSQSYHILVLDPHAALASEIGAFSQVIDFATTSIDLFATASAAQPSAASPVLSIELLLDVFSGLLVDAWNPRLERILRHSFCLLTITGNFSFANLRRLLLDLTERNELLAQAKPQILPDSTLDFWQMEYSEIKNRYYSEAVAPIISLIDEVELLPVFTHRHAATHQLSDLISHHPVTIVSLDRNQLGRRGVQVVAGLLFQQIVALIRSRTLRQHLILVVDEVAVISGPILAELLSEARKFGLSLILAGQYFGAIPAPLHTAILANTANYFLFRIAQEDAALLLSAIDLKIPLDDTPTRKLRTLTGLNNRQLVARFSIGDQLQPAVRACTMNYTAQPAAATQAQPAIAAVPTSLTAPQPTIYLFTATTAFALADILRHFSASRHRPPTPSLESQLIQSLVYYPNHYFNLKEPQ